LTMSSSVFLLKKTLPSSLQLRVFANACMPSFKFALTSSAFQAVWKVSQILGIS
jgi:hypothetical protein